MRTSLAFRITSPPPCCDPVVGGVARFSMKRQLYRLAQISAPITTAPPDQKLVFCRKSVRIIVTAAWPGVSEVHPGPKAYTAPPAAWDSLPRKVQSSRRMKPVAVAPVAAIPA